ncbi:alpha/beta hydrolase [Companilactobacillus mishanensis]|uniref:Alpha/beta hydrolase n=1 Tax=Companilactobacillus mishanensis TaxID=2486008 RepID=A0A5P0ZGG5_9LACO|nr:alpha/beta hydrolase [Companilactobacillus mishanensis]MQS52075.1 alpha/beta hydrolase [Companilactobacillus mishanensis]
MIDDQILNGVDIKMPQVDEYHDITYTQVPQGTNIRELKMSLLIPRTSQLKPAVLYFPGGGFTAANYHKFIQLRLALANKGMVVAAAEYRVIPDQFPAIMHDAKRALQYLYKNAELFGIDTSKIAVLGDSAGGYLSQFMGTTSDSKDVLPHGVTQAETKVAAVVSMYGISDLMRIGDGIDGTEAFHAGPTSPEAILVNGVSFGTDLSAGIQENPEKAREASPIDYIHPGLPPFLLMHGDKDVVVSCKQAEYMATALRDRGNEVKQVLVHGAGHGTPEWFQPTMIDFITDWLCEKLDWKDKVKLNISTQTL